MNRIITAITALTLSASSALADTAADLCSIPKSPAYEAADVKAGEPDFSDYRYLAGQYVYCPAVGTPQLCDTVVNDRGVSVPANCGMTG